MFRNRCHRFRFLFPLFILGIAALLTLAVFGIWNNVLTVVLDVKAITYWQALGILVLSKILFGGFPGRRGPGRFGPPGAFMMKQWDAMTPEQRDAMREEMRRRFGEWPRPFCQNKPGGHVPAQGSAPAEGQSAATPPQAPPAS